MGQTYSQLTQQERYGLELMRKQGQTFRAIAAVMGRSHTSLSRELQRNTGQRGYRHHQAQRLADQRQQTKPKIVKVTEPVVQYIQEKLQARWSPEQICGRLKQEQALALSPETIYRFVLKDKQQGGQLYGYLRHQAKPYRKRYGAKDSRGSIPGRVGIEERPAVVETRVRVGDWEADLIMGKTHKGAIVTLAERRARLFLAIPILRKTAELVTEAIITLLAPWKDWVATITYDNGREFSGHRQIAEALGCQGYFARPYHSWERGLNENSNGLLRQYFPKGRQLDTVSQEEVEAAADAMNHRPRKCLEFQTPWEVFKQWIQAQRPGPITGALMG